MIKYIYNGDIMEKETIKKTELIKEKNKKSGNIVENNRIYKCLCGKGKIIETRLPGFEFYITLECRRCEKHYHPFIDFSGNEWIIYKKD